MGQTAVKRHPETERIYTVDAEHLLAAIVDECENCVSFQVNQGSELVNIHIDMGVGTDIDYTIGDGLFSRIKEKLQKIYNIKAAEAAERKLIYG
jgi:hypothetical protein